MSQAPLYPSADPQVLGLCVPSSRCSSWLEELAAYKLKVYPCAGLDQMLSTLRERVVHLVILQETHPELELDRLAPLILDAAGDLPLVVASEREAPGCSARWAALGIRWAFSLGAPLPDSVQALQTIIDRVERLRAAEAAVKVLQSQINSEHGRFQKMGRIFRELNHELNTPLAVIQGYCANMIDGLAGPLTPEQQANLERIRFACELMNGVVKQVKKQMPRPEERKPALRPNARISHRRQFRITDLAREVSALFERPFAAKGLTLVLDLDSQCHPVWADRARLSQLLVNLLSNALRHTPTGGEVRVEVRPESPEGREGCRLTVRDNGEGIAPEHIDKIFLAGWSASENTTEERAGLGLAICREIAAEHAGRFWAESAQDQGASFHLQLLADPRNRTRQIVVQQIPDVALAGQLLLELHKLSSGPVKVREVQEMERLAAEIHAHGLPVILLGPPEERLERALGFIQGQKQGGGEPLPEDDRP